MEAILTHNFLKFIQYLIKLKSEGKERVQFYMLNLATI
jgi:hypothetical protein